MVSLVASGLIFKHLIFLCSRTLLIDANIVFIVLGKSIEALQFAHTRWRLREGLNELCQMAKDKMRDFKQFQRLILGAIEGGGGGLSALSVLAQDPETSTHFKMKIAAYVGVSFGRELRGARGVFMNSEYLISRLPPVEASAASR